MHTYLYLTQQSKDNERFKKINKIIMMIIVLIVMMNGDYLEISYWF